jgi:predicted nucleic acid-binding protein
VRFLLDTMVVLEPAKPKPDGGVLAWLEAQDPWDLAVSVLTLGEIQRGVERMAAGRRKAELAKWLATELPAHFGDGVLPVDAAVALAWGALTASSERLGRPLHVVNGLLLATARVHDLTLVTRNTSDTAERGIPVLDPWE